MKQEVFIYDLKRKKRLEPISIIFNSKGGIGRLTAHTPGRIPIDSGWYVFEGKDLDNIVISGSIEHNTDKMPQG